ncbi:unnamed protein product [Orchesella dallaii]|uniref:Uncharacterized protein n=1 Tax=Orchesella dallaii TaxID=48710 RepID=A0ABP1RMM8_9HEXA
MFNSCLLHIITNELEGDKNNFNVKPLEYPVVTTKYYYKLWDISAEDLASRNAIKCKTQGYQLINPNGFVFNAPPSIRQNCFIQIYLNAIPCSDKLTKSGRTMMTADSAAPHYNSTFALMDYRIFEHSKTYAIRCCIFFIHVESIESNPQILKMNYHRRFHYVDHIDPMEFAREPSPMFDASTRLSFALQFSRKKQTYVVVQTAVVACPDYYELYDYIIEYCQKLAFSPYNGCVQGAVFKRTFLTRLFRYNYLHESIITLEKIRVQCYLPVIEIIVRNSMNEPETLKQNSFRFLHQKTSEELSILMIFPNVSILDTKGYISLSVFPRFEFWSQVKPTQLSSKHDSIEFVTCAPILEPAFLSLIGYVSAFDVTTWLIIAFGMLTSMFLWYNSLTKCDGSCRLSEISFCYDILVGQSTPAITKVRWLTGAWVLAGFFLSNNYQGTNIDQLTSPLAPKKMETFEQIFNNNLSVFSLPLNYEALLLFFRKYKPAQPGAFGRANDQWWTSQQVTFAELYTIKQINMSIDDAYLALHGFVQAPATVNESLLMLSIQYYIEKISRCQHDVFVDRWSQVNKLRLKLLKLSINEATIATSKSSYGLLYQHWYFENTKIPANALQKRYSSLIHSGIIQFWKRLKYWTETLSDMFLTARISTTSVNALSTKDNIVVVFYVHLSLQSISLVLFLFECRQHIIIDIIIRTYVRQRLRLVMV